MSNPYWRIFAEEVPSDLGITLTDEQIDKLTNALEGAHENYGLGTGQEVADRNWRVAHDREVAETSAARVLRYIEDRVAVIDAGPTRCFDHMSHQQRLAMHEIFQAREMLRREAQRGEGG